MINYIECIYSLFTVVYTFVNDIESTFKRVYSLFTFERSYNHVFS